MRLVFAGTPDAAVPSLRRLAASDHDIAAVVTRRDAPVGRKRVITPSPVAMAADELGIETIEPERTLSFRWHPYAIEPGVDYTAEPTTLVVFSLADVPEGVLLTVTESGFDQIPLERRAKAFAANDGSWALAVTLLEKHLAQAA